MDFLFNKHAKYSKIIGVGSDVIFNDLPPTKTYVTEYHPLLDICFIKADYLFKSHNKVFFIKQKNFLEEKLMIFDCKKVVVICYNLNIGLVPIEIIKSFYNQFIKILQKNNLKYHLRFGETSNHNLIVDIEFNYFFIKNIKKITGVIETGLFTVN